MCSLLEVLGKKIFPCFFPVSGGCQHSLICVPFPLSSKPAMVAWVLLTLLRPDFHFFLLHFYRLDYIGPSQIIQDNSPISKSLIQLHSLSPFWLVRWHIHNFHFRILSFIINIFATTNMLANLTVARCLQQNYWACLHIFRAYSSATFYNSFWEFMMFLFILKLHSNS